MLEELGYLVFTHIHTHTHTHRRCVHWEELADLVLPHTHTHTHTHTAPLTGSHVPSGPSSNFGFLLCKMGLRLHNAVVEFTCAQFLLVVHKPTGAEFVCKRKRAFLRQFLFQCDFHTDPHSPTCDINFLVKLVLFYIKY